LLRRRPELLAALPPEAHALLGRFRGLSTNRSNLLRLQHDRVMRPIELQGLLLAWLDSGEPSDALAAWLCETCTDAPTLLAAPAAYDAAQVQDLGEAQLRWYRRRSEQGTPVRRLVVAFASNANAVSMIGPCFLQLLGPFAADVVLVLRQRPHHQSFFGADGAESLLARLVVALNDLVPLAAYREVVSVGYSGGGFASVVAAVALGADRCLSLGGWPPQGAVAIDQAWMEALQSGVPPPRPVQPHLLLCCAAGCAADVKGTALARDTVALWRLPITSVETRAYGGCRDHNLLVELQRRGYGLAPVLADLLFPADRPRHPLAFGARRARWGALPVAEA
jgi:hypothetical protein